MASEENRATTTGEPSKSETSAPGPAVPGDAVAPAAVSEDPASVPPVPPIVPPEPASVTPVPPEAPAEPVTAVPPEAPAEPVTPVPPEAPAEPVTAVPPVEAGTVVVDVAVLLKEREALINECNRRGDLLRKAFEINKAARAKAASAIRDAKKRERAHYVKQASKTREFHERQLDAAAAETAAATKMAEEALHSVDEMQKRIDRDGPMLSIADQHFAEGRPEGSRCVCLGCRANESRNELRKQIDELKKKNRELYEDLKSFRGPEGERSKKEREKRERKGGKR